MDETKVENPMKVIKRGREWVFQDGSDETIVKGGSFDDLLTFVSKKFFTASRLRDQQMHQAFDAAVLQYGIR